VNYFKKTQIFTIVSLEDLKYMQELSEESIRFFNQGKYNDTVNNFLLNSTEKLLILVMGIVKS
jgi:hypothetical protein